MNTETRQSAQNTTKEPEENLPGSKDLSTDHATKALRERVSGVLHYIGPYRVYFNRKEEAPRVVSIDNGTHAWEIVCKSVKLIDQDLRSTYSSGAEYPSPAFTLDGVGEITVDANGIATIR